MRPPGGTALDSALPVVRVTRLRVEPRSTAPPMASDDWNPQYEEYEAEFNTLREDMDALGLGASFKPLIPYENWGRYRPSKRTFIVGHARRDSKLATDRSKKAAAEAAAAFAAGSSQAGPSVRGRSNTRSPMLAMLTLCCLAQRSGSLTALARWSRARRRTRSWPPS